MNTVGRKFSIWEVITIDISDVAKDDIERPEEQGENHRFRAMRRHRRRMF